MGLTIWTERIGTTTLGIDLQALAQPIYRQTLWAHLASMPRLKSTGDDYEAPSGRSKYRMNISHEMSLQESPE